MYDLFVWYRKFNDQNVLSDQLKEDMKVFLTKERVEYFEKFGKHSRWLEFRDLVGV